MINYERSQLIPNTTLKSTLSHQTDRAMSLLTSLPCRVVASFLSSVSSLFTSSSLLLTLTVVTPPSDVIALDVPLLDGLARNAEGSKPSMGNWTILFDFTQWLLTNWNHFKWITCQWNRNGVKCKAPCKQMEHCWELLCPFVHSLRFDRFQTLRNNSQQQATGCANRRKM